MAKARHQPTEWRPCLAWRAAIRDIVSHHDVCRKDLEAGWRDARHVRCRHEIWWHLHKVMGVPLNQIGKRLGGFHHSTVLHGVRIRQAAIAGQPVQQLRATH